MSEALDRETIAIRATDLTQNDPHAAGIVDTIATNIGMLTPLPILDPTALGMTDEQTQTFRAMQKAIWASWTPFADAAGRMTYGAIQYLRERMLVQFGEYIILLPMLDDPSRPFSLACQVVNPLRLKTPTDLTSNPAIKDGVELGPYGEPIAYWIKKSPSASGLSGNLPDTSANFLRLPSRQGHRWNVLHSFVCQDPEQVRGVSAFRPGMKSFKDFGDFLDYELVANLITSAFTLFIEVEKGNDPLQIARNLSSLTESVTSGGTTQDHRYQEVEPGTVMYGETGQKPTPIKGDRPGVTFEPFTKIVKKALAASVNWPHAVLFSDTEGVNFAGFRSVMLAAWKVIQFHRALSGQGTDQRVYTMLQEEAYLRGAFDVPDFYLRIQTLTRCEWRGGPKGDIEPIKQVEANIKAIQNNIKTREAVIAEQDGDMDVVTVFNQLAKEQALMKQLGLTEAPVLPASPPSGESAVDPDNPDDASQGPENGGTNGQ
jgi:lambda family phage portal protein